MAEPMYLNIRPGHQRSSKWALVLGPPVCPLKFGQVRHRLDSVNRLRIRSRIGKAVDSRHQIDDKAGLAQMRAVRVSPSFHPL